MTIAGSDSGASTGIQADLKTFFALGVYGTSVITAVTAQNTVEVAAIAEVPEEVVIAQIDTIAEDIGADAVKTGMLVNQTIIQNVADRLEAWGFPFLVVDPVMVSRSGAPLLRSDAIQTLISELLPRATIVTPSIPEAVVLSGREISTLDDAREAARTIFALGPRIVVIKGGHFSGSASDLVFDGTDFHSIESALIENQATHETGCTFSAAVTAFLALGEVEIDAIRSAKRFVDATLSGSYPLGGGSSPVNHGAALPEALRCGRRF